MHRKIRVLAALVAVSVALPGIAGAQRVEVGPFGGWQFGGGLDTDDGRLGVASDIGWGGLLDIWVRADGLIEVVYSRQSTTVSLAAPLQPVDSLLGVTVQYLQVGGLYEPAVGRVRPFGGATVGVSWFDPDDTGLSGATKFSVSFVGGGKAYLTRRIGLRADARLLLTLFADETEVICRLPGACIVTASGQLMTQGAVSASLFVAF